tara:strand:- start:2127 stop:3638 length:1512 start_codon:yes stop_codon:yes gene_type:complete
MVNLLEVESLILTSLEAEDKVLLKDSNFSIEKGKIVSIVGESGSGKSLFAYSLMSKEFLYNAKKKFKSFKYNGQEIVDRYENNISYIPQEPLSSLNPTLTVLKHFETNAKSKLNDSEVKKIATNLLLEVGFHEIDILFKKFPHELSGGMAQRVLIALSLQNNPEMLIADEATSSLDTVNEKLILDLLVKISTNRQLTILIITHDPRIVSNYSSECYEVKDKKIIKYKNVFEIRRYYDDSRSLARNNLPEVEEIVNSRTELINLNNISFKFDKEKELILNNLNFSLNKGEAVGLIGLSGSGKSTISKLITKLLVPSSGEILYNGKNINQISSKDYSNKAQIVFQDLLGSLNPKRKIQNILLDSFFNIEKYNSNEKKEIIKNNLSKIRLPIEILNQFPSTLSGGQRQKILILKAILSNPEFIVFDEPMSSLDVKSQIEIISIIKELLRSKNFTVLFITHDFRLIEDLCEKVLVLSEGLIVEMGNTEEVFSSPSHEITRKLLQVVK